LEDPDEEGFLMNVKLLCVVWLLGTATAHADTVVTLCHIDDEKGVVPGPLPPRNLRDAAAAGGRVTFACPPNSVIRVSQPLDLASVNEIDGGNQVTLDGGGVSQILTVSDFTPGRLLILRNLTVQGGKAKPQANSGAISIFFTSDVFNKVPGAAVLDHVTIKNTERPVYFTSGKITITNSQFTSNTGDVVHVGIPPSPIIFLNSVTAAIVDTRFEGNAGAAVVARGDASLERVTVIGRADASDRGSQFDGGKLTIRNSHFSNLWSGALCGGAVKSTSTRITISGTTFTGNRSNCGGGAVHISSTSGSVDSSVHLTSLTFEDNQTLGRGGAIAFDDFKVNAAIDVTFSTFDNNRADLGGALAIRAGANAQAVFEATGLTFKDNAATQNGAAVYADGAQFSLTRGVFLENTPAMGGTLTIAAGSFTLANLLVARNRGPAAIQTAVNGDLVNSTVADNVGSGVQSAARLHVTNSVIANNRGRNCEFTGAAGALDDGGSNVQFPANACASSMTAADPMLDDFYVPDPKSPLQNAGLNAACVAAPVFARDVYGQRRPRSERCSIGAIEGDLAQLLHHVGEVGPSFAGPPFPSGPSGGGILGGLGAPERTCLLLLLLLVIACFTVRLAKRLHHGQ
jgi:predicted outer membrane repeat protein